MNRTHIRLVFYSVLTILIFVSAIFLLVFYPNRLKEEVIVEAGQMDWLTEQLFLKDGQKGTFRHDYSYIDLAFPTEHTIQVRVGYFTYTSKLIIQDTIAPLVKLKSIISPISKEIVPEDFILEIEDATITTVEFAQPVNIHDSGVHEVIIVVTDLGNNATVQTTTVLISQVKEIVTMEMGSGIPSLDDFLIDEKTSEEMITDLTKLKLTLGSYPVEIIIDGRILTSTLEVVDTTPPTATPAKLEVFVSDVVHPRSLVRSIVDATKVTATFKENKAWTSSAGTFNPIIVLTDESGNQTEIESTLVVKRDSTPPVLSGSGLSNRTVYVNEPYSYKNNIFASDNRDGRLAVQTIGTVDFATAGVYVVTFYAEDRAGNRASKDITITVKVKPPFVPVASTGNATLDAIVDDLFKTILHGDMNQYQISLSIYNFGRTIRYQAGPLASEWTARAVSSLNTRTGNCFGRMYAMRAMFTRAGISNRDRIQYNQDHSWNQINIGNGWQNVDVGYPNMFLVSDQYLKERALASSLINDDNWDVEAPKTDE